MVDTYNRLLGATATTVGKTPCRAATTGSNLFLSGFTSIDGVSFQSTDQVAGSSMRLLVKDQTDSRQNGIYLVNSGLWTREPDFDGNTDFVKGTSVFITDGNTNGGLFFVVTSADPQSVGQNGTTAKAIYFFPFGSSYPGTFTLNTNATSTTITIPGTMVSTSLFLFAPVLGQANAAAAQEMFPFIASISYTVSGGVTTINFQHPSTSLSLKYNYKAFP